MASCWNVSSLLRLSQLCAILSSGASTPGRFKGYRAVGSSERCWLRMMMLLIVQPQWSKKGYK